MAVELERWDVADNLQTPEHIAAYLEAVFEDGDPALIAAGLGNVARSKGMAEIARNAGVSRDTLYKALTEKGDPRLSTFIGVMKALGLKIVAQAA